MRAPPPLQPAFPCYDPLWGTPMVKTWRPVLSAPITSAFLIFPIFQRVSVQIWFHALQRQSRLAAAVRDSGMRERLSERRKPSYAHLIETNWPLWATHRTWLKPALGYLCLLKKKKIQVKFLINRHPARPVKSAGRISGHSRVKEPRKQLL